VVAGRGRVTLEFGPAIHPITGSWYLHKGFDVADFTGTPVVAMAEGTVTKAEFDPYGYGNQVVIEHKYGFETSYAHMNGIDVREGQWVQAGQRIGTVGMTGIATGTHVHVELSLGGQIIDPAPFIRLSNDFEPYSR
jgi:murein DD-endopeptidase MepM/ murein hydrolase activator NlpD